MIKQTFPWIRKRSLCELRSPRSFDISALNFRRWKMVKNTKSAPETEIKFITEVGKLILILAS